MPILTKDFYQREDTVQIAKDLLGKYLVTNFDGQRTVGCITETEAYSADRDKACHAYSNRRTNLLGDASIWLEDRGEGLLESEFIISLLST